MDYKTILQSHNIEVQESSKYNTTCPNCSPGRQKSDQKCLQVFVEDDCVVWQCNHPSCEWSQRQIEYYNKKVMKQEKIKFKLFDSNGKWTEEIKEFFDNGIKYPYYDRDERLSFYIVRVGDKHGKRIRPVALNTKGEYCMARPPGPYMPYRIEKFDPTKPTLIVEGEKAAEAAAKISKRSNVLSWVGGTNAIKDTDFSMLNGTEVIFWPDADEPGEKAFEEFCKLCAPSKLYKIDTSGLPEGTDIADIQDSELIKELFLNKELVDLDKPLAGELNPLDLQALHSKEYKYYPTGFANIDKYVRLPNSGLVVVSGRTNHGKTNFMINLALNLTKHTDLTVLYLSYEFPLTELNMRMVKALEQKKHGESGWEDDKFIDNAIRNMSLDSVKKYAEMLKNRKLRVVDSQTTIDDVLMVMNRLHALGKPVAVFIDYLQVIPILDSGKSRYLQLKEMVEKIRLTANANNQLLIGGSQLTAGEKGYQDTVRESKDIEFTAALHLKVWNKLKAAEKNDKSYDGVPGDQIVIVEKARQADANGRKFGFISNNGCDLQPVDVQYNKEEY